MAVSQKQQEMEEKVKKHLICAKNANHCNVAENTVSNIEVCDNVSNDMCSESKENREEVSVAMNSDNSVCDNNEMNLPVQSVGYKSDTSENTACDNT